MANISAIKLPNGIIYNLKDNGALQLTGGQVTGPVTFGSSVSIDEGTIGDLVVNGNASFANNINANTINGVAVGSSPKFTDTVTTISTTGSGNAITAITASNGVLSATKGTTFLTGDSTLNAAKLSGAIPSGVTATTQDSTDNSTKIATTAYVTTAIANLPEPMIFKGSVGTGGTITSLPAAAASNEGWTYKVITALSSPAAKVGDTVISNGSSWVVIPSGDEPSGTVTSVGISNGGGLSVSGGPITSSGTITIGHSNSVTAQTTQAVYPIKIDAQGHISGYGNAVTIPTKTSQLTNDSGFITNGGYECTETEVVFFNGSITTTDQGGMNMGMFTLSQSISGDTLTVTINDTEYELPKGDLDGQAYYGEISGGAPVFTNYPCLVFSQENSGFFYTENAGTYSVKIEGIVETTTITPCFQKAVKSSVNILEHLLDGQASGSLRSSTSVSEDGVYYIGEGAVALGVGTQASGMYSFAEGYNTKANAAYSHVEGAATTANGFYSHAEGNTTTANGDYSHAEGYHTTTSEYYSHAEGYYTSASGSAAHAEGTQTTASGAHSHAEGYYTTASGNYSHAEGNHTTANHRSQHTFGEYNILDPSSAAATSRGNYIEIVGNGTSTSARSNARTLDWSGNEVLAGKLTLGTGPTANMDAATKQYVDNLIPQVYSSTNTGGYLTMATLPIYDGTVV